MILNGKRNMQKQRMLSACITFASIFIAFSGTFSLFAAEPLRISVREAILKGLENNRALKVERLTPQIRKTFEADERAAFDPVLKGQISDSKSEAEQLLRYGATVTNLVNREPSGRIALEEVLPTGTRITLEGSTDLLDSSLYQGDFDSTRVGISITQSLLKGVGTGVNLARLRQAKLDTLVSEYELMGFSQELVGRIETTYWDYRLAQRQIEIYTDSLKFAEQQRNETLERITIGKTAKVEIAAAEAEVASRKEGLINARSQLEITRLAFLRLLNLPSTNLFDIEIVTTEQPSIPNAKLDAVSSHVQVAIQKRPDLNQARLNLEKGDLEVTKTKNGLLPRLDLFAALGNTGYADSFSGSMQNINGDYYDFTLGIQFEYPLGDRSASATHRRAILSREQAREAVENMVQLVEVDVRSAYIEVNRSSEQITATAATVKYREEALRAEIEKFRVGKSTSLLVAQAQRDLLASRIQAVQSIATHIKSLINLYRLEGSLLDRRGLSISITSNR
ncbi:MAG: TolC family protein [Kiritimatiellae bacterium]|nr:TolC family protein [Kiritimatiellia bacterium]